MNFPSNVKVNNTKNFKMKGRLIMNQAKKIETTNNWEYTSKNIGNNDSKDAQLENSVPCPRYVQEVYSLGASLQYYVGDKYLNLGVLNKGAQKSQYETLALNQLDYKEAIQKLANLYLNEMLVYFYNNGGPVIEAPVSEKPGQGNTAIL